MEILPNIETNSIQSNHLTSLTKLLRVRSFQVHLNHSSGASLVQAIGTKPNVHLGCRDANGFSSKSVKLHFFSIVSMKKCLRRGLLIED